MGKALEMIKQEKQTDKEGEKKTNQENENGCFWLPNLSWIELFFCFNTKKLNSLFLFHYNRKGSSSLEERLNHIVSITKRPETMHFKGGATQVMSSFLRKQFLWVQKWQTSFNPSEHCRITKKDNRSKDYTLTCDFPSNKTQKPAWTTTVLASHVHIPKIKI